MERQIRSAGVRVEKLGPSELKNIQTRVELFRILLEWQDRRPIVDTSPKKNKRRIKQIAVTAVASLVLLAAAGFWFVKRSSTKAPDALEPAYSSTKIPDANESSIPTEPRLESHSPPPVSLVPEFEEWKKLSLVTWNNSYLIDHAQQRYPEWRRAAETGDSVGQFFVGYCYQHGLTVPESPEQAVQWLTKSAEQGNSDAMLDLAICHGMGVGTQQDVAQYGRWIKAALDDGNTAAMVVHGAGLIAFSPVSSDKAGGKRLVYQAADAGNLDGVYASAFLKGQSPTEFNSRLTRAAEGGQPDALYIKAEGFESSPKGREMVSRALAMMGDPLAVARIIDPNQKLGFNHPNLYPELAWKRLRQMADE